jgi:outer membrane receptor for ferrienterochelin and colicins
MKIIFKILFLVVLIQFFGHLSFGQQQIIGVVLSESKPLKYVNIYCLQLEKGGATNENGIFNLGNCEDSLTLRVSGIGYHTKDVEFKCSDDTVLILLEKLDQELNEVVISGTFGEVIKRQSPLAIESFSSSYLQKAPSFGILEATQNINGVRPQLNCAVCNTGDIHINGMEGAYSMVTIDGMPIVGGLSSVYGLQGIPNSLLSRVEVIKGPASTLYGSEAMGGLINVITKSVNESDRLNVNYMLTSWLENQLDFHVKLKGKKVGSVLGADYHKYSNPIDNNGDNFTDLTLKDRITVFNKMEFTRKENRIGTVFMRYMYEDRWGGEMQWKPEHRGGDVFYGESILTSRIELITTYQLPIKKKVIWQSSVSQHDQNSFYGTTHYKGQQRILFSQLIHPFTKGVKHSGMVALTFRNTFYDDNTTATQVDVLSGQNLPNYQQFSGILAQDEYLINEKQVILVGLRYDYHNVHGSILTPRVNYKWANNKSLLRVSYGNGFRVVNIFAEDHAALSGSREVVIANTINPERSHNGTLNFERYFTTEKSFITMDMSIFYTYFSNKIIPDYEANDELIIYDNIQGYAVSKGVSATLKMTFDFPLKITLGGTLMDVYQMEQTTNQLIKNRQLFSEHFSGTWTVSYVFYKIGLTLDYTGNIISPMKLPIVENDYRADESPWFSIQNIKFSKSIKKDISLSVGLRNFLNFTPPSNSIMRAFDPFDQTANNILTNPNGYTFDPSYIYSSFQGINAFFGINFKLK